MTRRPFEVSLEELRVRAGQREEEQVEARAPALPCALVLRRYSAEEGITIERAQEDVRELRRRLILGAIRRLEVPWAGRLDRLWHACILDTKTYLPFCQEVVGGYIHHVPQDATHTPSAATRDAFRAAYFAAYGEFPRDPGLVQRTPTSETRSRAVEPHEARLGSRERWRSQISRLRAFYLPDVPPPGDNDLDVCSFLPNDETDDGGAGGDGDEPTDDINIDEGPTDGGPDHNT